MNFGLLDWAVIAAFLALSFALGTRAKRCVEDLDGYMVAGRKVGSSLGIATFVGTEIGTVTFVYFAELGYLTGFSAFFLGVFALLAFTFVGRTGFIIKGLRRHDVMTISEFYETRYSRRVRMLGRTVLFLGGMLSVVVTDYLLFVVLAAGMLIATVFVLLHSDLAELGRAVTVILGQAGVDPVANPRFGWTFVIRNLISNVAGGALWQPGTSKALASATPEVARRVYFRTGMTFAGRAIIPMFWGIAALRCSSSSGR